jgi:HK97 family phage major capsid protein
MAQAIESAMSKKMALELDRAAINGSGVGEEPLSLLNTPGIFDEAAGGPLISYAAFVKAMGHVRSANENPTAVIMHSDSQTALDLLVDTLGQPLRSIGSAWGGQ